MQFNSRTFDAGIIKSNIEDLHKDSKLVVETNTLSMLLVVQMFFMRADRKDNTIKDVTSTAFASIKKHMLNAK